jgi:hypothetical protein
MGSGTQASTWRAPIEVANAAKKKIRKDRQELLDALDGGLINFADVLSNAIDGGSHLLTRAPVFTLMVMSGLQKKEAITVLRWMAVHLGWPVDVDLRKVALRQLVDPRRRYTHVVALADGLTASEREAPSFEYPCQRLGGRGDVKSE